MNSAPEYIYVYADWAELQTPTLMGCLYCQRTRGKEVFSFEFDSVWLKSKSALMLDPDLHLYSGRQYADSGKQGFGLFLDSAPDRWGRQLIRRREAIQSRRESRPIRQLLESDYLLGVHDLTRMGALRFALEESGDFIERGFELAAPPWTSLRELEAACRHYESESPSDSEHEKWLNMLLAPGSSLGGARPKANVLDADDNLWIAKFPSRADSLNTGAWEMVTHILAQKTGLNVPVCRIETFSKYGSTFLTRRFDRNTGRRVHFASAMTLLGRRDGEAHTEGSSYLDLAQFIVRYGANPNEDLQELWQRIVFSIAVSNTDDHLRNHGFLLTPQGWSLSPAYDMNPNPHGNGLALNISMDDNALDFELALSVASLFRLEVSQANEELDHIRETVSHWRNVAQKLGIPREEIEMMAFAFR